ncbi:MAG: hypothetical protein PHV36_01730 [Elusimicrobiales bacterium]|nr:hypothetical protein [Elusimicrobiales bacterium]
MKLKTNFLILSVILAIPAAGYSAAPSAEEVNCASEDMQVLYYYLAPEPGQAVKERPTKCHGAQATLKMPDWLEKSLPAMRERKVWKDPEEGDLSEAQLWQTAFSILYELAATTQKTLPNSAGGAALAPAALETQYNEMRLRYIMSVDRITRAGLEGSFGGRGTALLSTMNSVMERLDGMTGAIAKGDKEAFNTNAGGALKLSREVFAQMFEVPRAAAGKFKPKYAPEARVLPGYRGVSLKVSGSQALFLESGDRADMLVTFDAIMGSGDKEKVTATILQNVVVVKVFKPASPAESGVVQLLCNPNEAQYASLSLAQANNIVLVRRAAGDFEMRPMEIASFRKLFK